MYFLVFSLGLVSTENIYHTTVFDRLFKHLEAHQKYSAARRILTPFSVFGNVVKHGLLVVFGILHKTPPKNEKRVDQTTSYGVFWLGKTMLVRMWQNVKFTSFLCRRKIYTSSHLLKYQVVYFFMWRWKFTHQVIYLNTKSSIFCVKVKIYTSSLLLCYQLPIF